jgi:Tfp pilus assembly protein FimT
VAELVIVVTILGVLLAIAIPRGQLVLDRISVRAAASDVEAVLSSARSLALAGHSLVAVDIDSASGVLRVRRGAELLLARNLGQAHGVQVGRTRDSLAYDAHGLGHGAANLSVIIRRRSAAETVFVSRFGRVR